MNSRRDFLQTLSLGIGAATLTDLTPAISAPFSTNAPKADKQLRVALMGLGGYANIVARGMKECKTAKLVGIVTGTPSKIPEWKQKYGIEDKNVYNYENLHEIKNNPDIDLVYVITPNSLHHKHVLQVAAAIAVLTPG